MKTNFINDRRVCAFVDESRIAEISYQDTNLEPLVSVVVPVYGAESTLAEALASIEVQSMPNLEIVCVNDASPDGSAEIIEQRARADSRYVVLTHAHNCGYGASMNDGIAASRGQWVAILEPDDYILPNMYEKMLDALQNVSAFGEGVQVVKTPYIREVRENGTPRGGKPKELLNCSYRGRVVPKKQPFSLADEGVSHLLRHHPSIWSALYRVSYLAEKDIRFVEYPGSGWADNEFFYETLLNASSVVYLDEPFYVYREETPEEFQAFAHREKMLRFDRWQAMADIIDRLGITAPSILASHVAKGFTYLGEEIAAWGESDPDIVRGMQDMFARMEACFVKSEALVPPHLKRLYFAWKGEKIPGNAKLSYGLALVGELVYTAKNNGKDYAFNQIKHVLKG